ncbi:MAG: MBOAT family protein [Pseudomonadota bacterium]
MLFNSYVFMFVFLPVVLAGYALLARIGGRRAALGWLTISSLFFYGWWNPAYLVLLGLSILVNFTLGRYLAMRTADARQGGVNPSSLPLIFGIVFNLGLIIYFKYAGFLVSNVNAIAGSSWDIGTVILPLAISFFTFQQITYLVDTHGGAPNEPSLLNYTLFVSFFPQLIAGPIVHHSEMMPQFRDQSRKALSAENLSVGLTLFAIGLFKKAVLADGIAVYATPVFAASDAGEPIDLLTAWGGALAYTFQLYFDFSGYCDMAMGAARLFGITLPINFNSPYKSVNIIDFWRRWHITLSRFLRDYVYIPLGGNRRGMARRYINLAATMLIGGLWHGAGWTFVVWGGLHGLYLVVNHGWLWIKKRIFANAGHSTWIGRRLGQLITFVAVVFAWVYFRSVSFEGANGLVLAMVGQSGITLPSAIFSALGPLADVLAGFGITASDGGGGRFVATWGWIIALATIAFLAPNSIDLMRSHRPVIDTPDITMEPRSGPGQWLRGFEHREWHPRPSWVAATAFLLTLGILALPEVSEFLYFQF